jgi:exodeoxyribonuclease V beta subunit
MSQDFSLAEHPLKNGTLIEASAGTGKTYSVAAYVTHAIAAEEGLRIGNILVATYTRNAAAELRDRIRGRMVATARILRGRQVVGQTHDLLDQHLLNGIEERLVKARRLERAIAEFDTATIGTIHSICSRVLRMAGVEAAETGDDDLLDRVLEEVVNDAVVSQAFGETSRLWDERPLRELVRAILRDPFVVPWFDPADRSPEETASLQAASSIVTACVARVHERMQATPSFDDLLRRAWKEVRENRLFRDVLRERFRLAIVDEAQDTSRLQWEFLHEIFPPNGDRPLISVGDPKQAIYGFRGADVTAYLRFSDRNQHLGGADPLRRTLAVNRRSDGPLLEGLNATMQGAEFGRGIEYQRVMPADGREAAKLSGLLPVEFLDVGTMSLADAAARKVADLLTARQFAPAATRSFRPGEICLLVRSNAVGSAIEKRLAALGIPAVTTGTASVMAGQTADDVRVLLEAMERPGKIGRVRRAAATMFFGVPLAEVARLGETGEQQVQERINELHVCLQRRGVAAMAAEIMADAAMAARIASGPGGERRIVDFSHLIEVLNDACGAGGCHARVGLEHYAALALKDEKAELVSRRVESDSDAVKIMSVHAAKGLQFPAVVVVDRWTEKKKLQAPAVFYENDSRLLDIGYAIDGIGTTDRSKEQVLAAENEELRRLIYVAVTRPEHHVCILRAEKWEQSLLAAVMPQAPFSGDRIDGALAGMLAVRSIGDLPEPSSWTPPKDETIVHSPGLAPMPTTVEQVFQRTSFSDITAKAARGFPDSRLSAFQPPVGQGHDEAIETLAGGASAEALEQADTTAATDIAVGAAAVGSFTIADLPAGTAFGSVVHEILERVDAGPHVEPAELRASIRQVVDAVATARFLQPHHDDLTSMIDAAMQTPFGGPSGAAFRGLRFADFSATDRLPEMTFEMGLAGLGHGVRARDVGRVLRQFIPPADPLAGYADLLAGAAFEQPLAGLINGSIDAVLRLPGLPEADPRLLIADYKTNKLHRRDDSRPLAAYAPTQLVAAMGVHHYPLQALVYGTAVWRMLRWRLGPQKPSGWDPGECIAGVVYGFVRGMKGPDTPLDEAGHRYGVFTWQPPQGIWRRLSDLFAGDLRGVRS